MSDETCTCGCSTQPENETKDDCTCGCQSRGEQEPKADTLA
jgi:hypothetical protein